MKTSLKNGLIGVTALAIGMLAYTVYHDRSADAEAEARREKIWAHEGALVDACDAAYGQGRLVPPSVFVRRSQAQT